MKLPGTRPLSFLLIGTLLLCHGVFGALHLVCASPECAGHAEHPAGHPAEHHAAAGAGGTHEPPAGHAASTEYFAVLAVGFLGLLFGLLPKSRPVRIGLDARWPVVLRRVPAVLRPPPIPAPLTLRVFRL
jgi:hypothetical protein